MDYESDSFSVISNGSESSSVYDEEELSDIKDRLYKLVQQLEKDYCVTEDGKIEKKGINPQMDLQESCDFRNQHEDFLNYLVNIFRTLDEIINISVNFSCRENINVICFVGTTGAGKSTLVQILGSDNSKIFSEEVGEGNFIISDKSKIGTDTIISKTLYPELVTDKKSKYVFCDTPGFQENRGPIYEIIGFTVMKKIFQHLKSMKIVLVCPQSSLKQGGNRNEFINLLKYLITFIQDVNKFRNSIYLIGSKVENSPIMKNGKLDILPDISIVNNIAMFLGEIKATYTNKNVSNYSLSEMDVYDKSLQIVESLLVKNEDEIYTHINILRTPMEEECLKNNIVLQSEITAIRKTLLVDKDFEKINQEDFCTILSDGTLKFLDVVFEAINGYVTDISKAISIELIKNNELMVKCKLNFDELEDILKKLIEKNSTLCCSIEKCNDPKEYFHEINKFSCESNLSISALRRFNEVLYLNEFFTDLEIKTCSRKFSPLLWSAAIRSVSDFLNEKLEDNRFLKEVFSLLSSYEIQKQRKHFQQDYKFDVKNMKIEEDDFIIFLEKNNLIRNFSNISFHSLRNEFMSIIKFTVDHEIKINQIDPNTLIIVDNYVLFSELIDCLSKRTQNSSINKIIIFALHTVYIDSDLQRDWISGKNLIIYAPIWKVIGVRYINVDGMDQTEALPKADIGEIGKDGEGGHPGGKFLGLGMFFDNNENLLISSRGGCGQNGQDGGDGMDGKNGLNYDQIKKENVKNHSFFLSGAYNNVFKTTVYEGMKGTPGGDSGEGGNGGPGGEKGEVTVYSICEKIHNIKIVVENGPNGIKGNDGKPGKGGLYGKSKNEQTQKHFVLFIPVVSDTETIEMDEGKRAKDGEVKRKSSKTNTITTSYAWENFLKLFFSANHSSRNVTLIKENLELFQQYSLFIKNSSILTDGLTANFIDYGNKYILKLDRH